MRTRLWCLLSVSAACALASRSARADDPVTACAADYEQAQLLRQQGHYIEAAKLGTACAKPACGALISGECSKLYEAIQADMPTVVVGAKDGEQNDLTDVRVFVDGVLVREKLNGSPFAIDPGNHVFRFDAHNGPVVEKSYNVRAGEKLRVISETLGDKPPPKAPTSPNVPQGEPGISVSPRALRIGGFVTAGIGVLAFAGFGGFRWLAYHDYDRLNTTCVDACAPADVDVVRRSFLVSNILLGVGIAATGTAGTLLLWSLGKGDTTARVGVVPQPGGGALSFKAQF